MPLKRYLARFPLTDRMTFATEMVSSVLYGVFAGLALPLIPIVARRIGMSPEAITAMVTMQFVGALSGIVVGHMADRLPKLPLAVLPWLISRALIGLLFFARTPVFYLAVVSAFNLLVNIAGPAYGSIMRSNYSDAHRGRLMGNIRIAIVTVSAIFSTLAGALLAGNEVLVRWLFPAAALFGVLSALTFTRIRVRRGPPADSALAGSPPAPASFTASLRASLGGMRRNAPFLLFMGILAVCATPDKMSIPLEPIWLVDHLRISYGDASFVLGTVASVASIAGYFIWARALKKLSSFSVLAVVVFLFAGRFAAFGLARTSAGLVPMSILSGLTNSGWDLVPIFCMIALTDAATFSMALGLSTTLFGIRGILGPWVGTLLYSSGALPLQDIFFLIAGITTAGGVLLLVFSRGQRARRRAAGQAVPPYSSSSSTSR
jgi:MFS family permease